MTAGSSLLHQDCRARPSTPWTAIFIEDGRHALPSLSTLPGTPGTIRHQGPVGRPGRLGTLEGSSSKAKISKVKGGEWTVKRSEERRTEGLWKRMEEK